ncbi:MAG: hypothetical protein AABX82_09030 [Nanoarchaeota archaeon]
MTQNSNASFFLTGKYSGYLFSFFLFSTVLYFVLFFTGKIPASWTYFFIFFITIPVAVAGFLIERYLQ